MPLPHPNNATLMFIHITGLRKISLDVNDLCIASAVWMRCYVLGHDLLFQSSGLLLDRAATECEPNSLVMSSNRLKDDEGEIFLTAPSPVNTHIALEIQCLDGVERDRIREVRVEIQRESDFSVITHRTSVRENDRWLLLSARD